MKSLLLKFSVILLIFGLAFAYGSWWKSKSANSSDDFLILKQVPAFSMNDVFSDKKITNETVFNGSGRDVYVHFWATWCAPCEAELPDFISYAMREENSAKLFLLVAVNDDVKKIKKFLKKISDKFSSNILFVLDGSGVGRSGFGTVKVPETYLFNGTGRAIKKFVGVQSWN